MSARQARTEMIASAPLAMRYFVTIAGEEHIVDVQPLPEGGYQTVSTRVAADGSEQAGEAHIARVMQSAGELNPAGGQAGKACERQIHIAGKHSARPQVFDLLLEGQAPGQLEVFANGRHTSLQVETERSRAAAQVRGQKPAGADAGLIKSPMPGKVVKILVEVGAEVQPGEALIVVEAMKMENELAAAAPGRVKEIRVQTGSAVEGGAVLISLEPLG